MSAHFEHFSILLFLLSFESGCLICGKKLYQTYLLPGELNHIETLSPKVRATALPRLLPVCSPCPKNPLLAAEDPLSKWKENGILKYDFIRNVCTLDSTLFSSEFSRVGKMASLCAAFWGQIFLLPIPFPDLSLV